jgi:hypothetical protein
VALSTSYWPIVRPERGRFALAIRKAEIALPVRPPSSSDTTLPGFAVPDRARGVQWLDLDAPLSSRELSRESNVHVHRFTIDAREDGGPAMSRLEPIDLEIGSTIAEEFRITEGEPGSASLEVRQEVVLRRKGWDVHVRTEHRMTAEPDAYILRASVETWEHDIAVFSRLWEVRIPR